MGRPPEPPCLEIEVKTVTTKTVTAIGIVKYSGLFASKPETLPEPESTAVVYSASVVLSEPSLQGNNPSEDLQTS